MMPVGQHLLRWDGVCISVAGQHDYGQRTANGATAAKLLTMATLALALPLAECTPKAMAAPVSVPDAGLFHPGAASAKPDANWPAGDRAKPGPPATAGPAWFQTLNPALPHFGPLGVAATGRTVAGAMAGGLTTATLAMRCFAPLRIWPAARLRRLTRASSRSFQKPSPTRQRTGWRANLLESQRPPELNLAT